MHEYRRFVEAEMTARGWNANRLSEYAGLNRQTVYNIVKDDRDRLTQIPKAETIDGLAKAFSISREKILTRVAAAMGLPVTSFDADLSAATDDELIRELTVRLKRSATPSNLVDLNRRQREADETPIEEIEKMAAYRPKDGENE